MYVQVSEPLANTTDVRKKALWEKWGETSGCHTTVVAIASSKLDKMLDASAGMYIWPEEPNKCCLIDELSCRTLRGFMADMTESVSSDMFISKLANLLVNAGIGIDAAIGVAETKFRHLTRPADNVITMADMQRITHLKPHEANLRTYSTDTLPNTLIEGTGMVEVGKMDHATATDCMRHAHHHCDKAGVPFEYMHSSYETPLWYRAAVMVVIRGVEYICQDRTTHVLGVSMSKLLQESGQVLLQPMHRVLSHDERDACHRRLLAILPRPKIRELRYSEPVPANTDIGKWVLLKGPKTEAMQELPGFASFPLSEGVNVNILRCNLTD
jgi:hypothetical protein